MGAMTVLVANASRHGSTASIADRLAARLTERGHRVELVDLTTEQRDEIGRYDAFVIGSAVYEGHWLRPARRFVMRHAAVLQHRPVWLFSSGPLDDDRIGLDDRHVAELVGAVDARQHVLLPGALDRSQLGRVERWIVDVVRAHEGDFRDWEAIDAWAYTIADELDAAGATNAPSH